MSGAAVLSVRAPWGFFLLRAALLRRRPRPRRAELLPSQLSDCISRARFPCAMFPFLAFLGASLLLALLGSPRLRGVLAAVAGPRLFSQLRRKGSAAPSARRAWPRRALRGGSLEPPRASPGAAAADGSDKQLGKGVDGSDEAASGAPKTSQLSFTRSDWCQPTFHIAPVRELATPSGSVMFDAPLARILRRLRIPLPFCLGFMLDGLTALSDENPARISLDVRISCRTRAG